MVGILFSVVDKPELLRPIACSVAYYWLFCACYLGLSIMDKLNRLLARSTASIASLSVPYQKLMPSISTDSLSYFYMRDLSVGS